MAAEKQCNDRQWNEQLLTCSTGDSCSSERAAGMLSSTVFCSRSFQACSTSQESWLQGMELVAVISSAYWCLDTAGEHSLWLLEKSNKKISLQMVDKWPDLAHIK